MRSTIGFVEEVFRMAKSEESESVRRRRNFPSEGDRVSRDGQANMAVSSATYGELLWCQLSNMRTQFFIRSGAVIRHVT